MGSDAVACNNNKKHNDDEEKPQGQVSSIILVRPYAKETDLWQVESLERSCAAGLAGGGGSSSSSPSSSSTLFVDLLGDPVCRVRHLPVYTMLVAEISGDDHRRSSSCQQIVGVLRAGVKDVVCGTKKIVTAAAAAASVDQQQQQKQLENAPTAAATVEVPVYARVGYLLGLRVCPSYRKMGIAKKLVKNMEEWCKDQQAEYVYMATEKDNEASVKLFTESLNYMRFRTPVILVHPVFLRDRPLPPDVRLTKLSVEGATALYRATMGSTEFFPKDIHSVLGNELCAGTWVATFAGENQQLMSSSCATAPAGLMQNSTMMSTSSAISWAMVSIWRTNEVFKFEQKGASWGIRTLASASRWLEWLLYPWLLIPSIPNLFNSSFGFQFMFGLHSQGARGHELLNALCWHAHNTARKHGCQAFATEVAASDPARSCIPHWERLSSCEDLWCIKRIGTTTTTTTPPPPILHSNSVVAAADHHHHHQEPEDFDNTQWWCKSPSPHELQSKLFVDPREV
ncbi:unnamed protein product [Sphagnum compactum]